MASVWGADSFAARQHPTVVPVRSVDVFDGVLYSVHCEGHGIMLI